MPWRKFWLWQVRNCFVGFVVKRRSQLMHNTCIRPCIFSREGFVVFTINSEIFARVLFSNKVIMKWRNHCSLLIYVNHALFTIFSVANMSFNAIRENKILVKFFGFIVPFLHWWMDHWRNSFAVLSIIERWKRMNIYLQNPTPVSLPGFVAYLIEDKADNQKNAILAPLVVSHDPGITVSREPNIHSGSFNNSKRFSTDVAFNMVCSIAKSR